ncbi:MAG: 1,4-dihydroxy-2-naphthoate polyprenyltransferase [Acidimicrobiia bacterium]|nr:1,4-dihydroxy-2-naphthoate polyprenyltransferase [Acidimicrobiia bacterium]
MSVHPTGIRLWIAGARPKTLPAAVVPVVVGTAAVAEDEFIPWRFLAAMVVALALQVGTNYANDYSDGIRGTDDDRVGPLRLVGSGAASPAQVKAALIASFVVAGIVGLVLSLAVNPWLLAIGAASIAAGWFYTGGKNPYGYLGLGEVVVFVFFGIVATTGSAYVQTEELSGLALVLSVPVGVFATALLVINNLRDREGDEAMGKTTLAVRLGDSRTRLLYTASMTGAFVLIALVAAVAARPALLLGLFGFGVSMPGILAVRAGATGRDLIPVLESTARTQLVSGLLLTFGLLL